MMRPGPSAFLRSETGSGAVEFALVALIFLGIMLGVIDMGRLAFELNGQKAATRAGARFAVTNAMASMAMRGDWVSTLGNGAKVANFSDTCNSSSCTAGGRDGAAFTAIVTEMQKYNAQIQPANVVVVYDHVGIGVVGNPNAPDVEPLVTVSLTGLTFAPGSLQIFGLAPFSMPSMATTLSGEDLN